MLPRIGRGNTGTELLVAVPMSSDRFTSVEPVDPVEPLFFNRRSTR